MSSTNRDALFATAKAASGAAHRRLLTLIGGRNPLEIVMTTIVVNNPTDTPMAGQTNLRQAIAEANALGGGAAIVFDKNVFSGPQTITLTAGALEITNSTGPLTITGPGARNLTIDGNNLSRVFQVDINTTVSISGLTVEGGNAGISADGGGGLLNFGTLTVSNTNFTGNSAVSGGGIANDGELTLSNSTLSGNVATNGGGIDNSGTATLTNDTLSGNSALSFNGASSGGGIDNSGTATLTNATLSNNSATNGGGIDNSGTATLTLDNTIVAENTADDIAGTVSSASGNLIGIGGASGLSDPTNQVGTVAHPINPKLGPLANNGGPTDTMVPLPGSPAIGKGILTVVFPGETDQRGFPRIVDGTVDIGAVEVQDIAELPMLTGGSPNPNPPPSVTVHPGTPASLGTVIPVDSDDLLSVTISGVPAFESITVPSASGYTVTRSGNGNGDTITITETAGTAGQPISLMLSSNFKGKGKGGPVNTFTVTASNNTSGETGTSPPQYITVQDPPLSSKSGTGSHSLSDLMSQFGAGDSPSPNHGPSTTFSSSSPTSNLAALIESHTASSFAALSGGATGLLSNPLTSSDQKAFLTNSSHA
jgi:hypothetical protein